MSEIGLSTISDHDPEDTLEPLEVDIYTIICINMQIYSCIHIYL